MKKVTVFFMAIFLCTLSACDSKKKTNELAGKHVLIVMPDRSFFDPEYSEPLEALKNRGCKVDVANETGKTSVGIRKMEVKADMKIDDAQEKKYDAILLVGGYGAASLYGNKALIKLIQDFNKSGKLIGAQCYSPVVVAEAGLLKGKTATCWPSQMGELEANGAKFSDDVVVTTGNIITAQAGGYGNIQAFTDEFIGMLTN